MTAPGDLFTVPDLYCSEVLPDFDSASQDLYSHPTSTKDSAENGSCGGNIPCAICSSSLCNEGGSATSSHRWLSLECNDQVSYHDIWCDDSKPWTFDTEKEAKGSDDDENHTPPSYVSPDSTVPQLCPSTGEEHMQDNVQEGFVPQHQSEVLHDTSSDTGVLEELSDPDIFAVDESQRLVPGFDSSEAADEVGWWDYSQLSSLSQTSQSSVGEYDDNSQLVPTLRSILRHHRSNTEQDEDNENSQRRGQLLFNGACSTAEQIVPNWPTEE